EGIHGFPCGRSSQPVPGRHALRGRGPRRRTGPPSHPFAISGVSRWPPRQTTGRPGAPGALAPTAPLSARQGSKIISGIGTAWRPGRLNRNAGWSAPQPPTPHPSGDRPWPFWRRGLPLWALVENGHGNGTRVRRSRLNALARYPMRAGVGAGLADLSLRDETRRVFFSRSSGATCRARESTHDFRGVLLPACALSPAHHQIIPVHHFGAAAEPEDRENVGGRAALDLGGVLGVVGDEAAADLGPIGSADDDGVAARENALDVDDARGEQALAAAQRRDRTGIDGQDTLGLE